MTPQVKKTLSIALAVVIIYALAGVVYSAFRNDKISLSESQAAERKQNQGRCDDCNVFDWIFKPFGTPTPVVDVGPETYRLPENN